MPLPSGKLYTTARAITPVACRDGVHSYFNKVLGVVIVSIAILLSIIIAQVAFAVEEEVASETVSLDELVGIGLKDNPGLESARLAWERTIEKYPQATALEDPMLVYTQPISEVETRLGPVARSLMVSQKLPFPGKLRVKGKIVNKDIEISKIKYIAVARDLVLEIKEAYFELFYLDKATELARERIKVFDHFTRAEMNDYSVGGTGFSDVVSAETRFADAEYDLILLEELRKATVTRINTLLNRDPEYRIASVEEPVIEEDKTDLTTLYSLIGNHESIRAADLGIEKSKLQEKLSGFSSKPNFMVGLKYSEIGDPAMGSISDGGRDAVAVNVGLSIPLWFGKNRAKKQEAKLGYQQSKQERRALSDNLSSKAKKVYVDMSSNYKLVRLYSDTLIPKAGKLIKTVEIMYKNGNGSIADIFEAQSMWINFRLAYYRAASHYLKNRADLERLTAGYELEEENVDWL